uniref:Uncharacterized protein n=1 Tax=Aegilops tauschii subsp. strangulata TaxID=200361 RepID=A0A453LJ29_AEGTS|nr:protein prickle [Aegilops tauschii subsp. strangulata]
MATTTRKEEGPDKRVKQQQQGGTKLYSRMLSKDVAIAVPSFRVYYGVASAGSVPFLWESQPGTPKSSPSVRGRGGLWAAPEVEEQRDGERRAAGLNHHGHPQAAAALVWGKRSRRRSPASSSAAGGRRGASGPARPRRWTTAPAPPPSTPARPPAAARTAPSACRGTAARAPRWRRRRRCLLPPPALLWVDPLSHAPMADGIALEWSRGRVGRED